MENGGFLQAGYGNYDNREITGAGNLVIVPDRLAIRFAGEVRRRDGFTRNLRDGQKLDDINYNAYRLGVLFTPTERIENYLLFMYNRSSTNGTGFVLTDVNPAGVGASIFGAGLSAELVAAGQRGVRVTNSDSQNWFYTKNVMALNATKIDLPYNLTLKNIVSFTRSRSSGGFDIDGTPFPLVTYLRVGNSNNPSLQGASRNDYLTEELQLSGDSLDGKLTFVAGGFYQHYYPYGTQQQSVVQFGAPSFVEADEKGVTKAFYVQSTFDSGAIASTLNGLKLTVGYRYTWDSKSYVASSWSASSRACTGQPGKFYPNCDLLYVGKWAAPTWTVSLDYKVTSNALVYASYRTGYKSGGFNAGADPSFPFAVFGPEEVQDYELGLKSDWNLGPVQLRANLALFKDDYSAIQRNQSFIVPGSNPPRFTNVVGNSGIATIKGLEGQLFAKVGGKLDIDLNYSYLESRYENTVPAAFITKGTPLPYAPKHKLGGAVTYRAIESEELGEFSVNASASYQSTYRWGDRDQPGNLLGDYTLVNLGANWRRVYGRPIDVELFVTNVANKAYRAGALAYYYATGAVAASYTGPRMYGVRLRYTFGGG
jgi:iron complex outermembrane receptor protein